MAKINPQNAQQMQQMLRNGGCLKRVLIIAAVVFLGIYLMRSCGGSLINLGGRGSSYEGGGTSSTDNNTITMPDMTPNSNTNTTNTTTNSGDYSWIVGTWDCDMGAYGKMVMNFEGDGSSGRCSELKPDGTYKYGTYQVNGNVLSYKLTGESFSTTFQIESGHRLSDGDGQYFRKRN